MAFFRWLFWRVYYLFRGRPRDLAGFMESLMRTRWPWTKFKPYVWHNDAGREWEIYLTNEPCYCRHINTGDLKIDVMVEDDSGRICGLRLFDSTVNKDWREQPQ
jgi:hypothetical protein